MAKFYTTEKLSEHISETPEGFLICKDVPIARTGEQIYKPEEVSIDPGKDGLVTVKRDEQEVFNERTISSFEGKPLTINHPDEKVTPENWSELAHGYAQNIRRGIREQTDLLIADIVVTTKKAIELIKNGLRQISCGYDAEYEQIKDGLAKQKDIIGNHIALVMRGRAGARCAIGDKECTNCGDCKDKHTQEDDMKIKKFKDALLKFLDSWNDEDEEEQKAKELAEKEAKDQETTEKEKEEEKTKDQDPEEKKEEKEEAKDEEASEEEKKKEEAKDQENEAEKMSKLDGILAKIDSLTGTVATLQKAIESLVQSDKAVHETIGQDQDPEEKKEEMIKDFDKVWIDTVSKSNLLTDKSFSKPTNDHAKALENVKKESLKAVTKDSQIFQLLKGKDINKLSGESLDMAFNGAVEIVKVRNNKITRDSIRPIASVGGPKSTLDQIKDMQKKANEFWKRN